MTLRRMLIPLLAALACALGATAARAGGQPLPGFVACPGGHAPYARMPTIVLACGDGNFYVTGLRWQHWQTGSASAAGTAHANDCTPDCAAGHWHLYPLGVTLSRPVTCPHGRTGREFTRLSYRFPDARPAGLTRTGSLTVRCS